MTQDFTAVKAEMAAVGLGDGGGLDVSQVRNVIRAFQKYGYSLSKILNAFAEVIEIKDAREDIKQQKQEIEEQRKVLDRRLEDLGFGDFEKPTQTVAALMTLTQYGIGFDKIISISQGLRRQQQQWGMQEHASNLNGSSRESNITSR